MTTPLEAKLAFHREFVCVSLGKANSTHWFRDHLDEAYAEIDRLFDEEYGDPNPIVRQLAGVEASRQFSNNLADYACPTAGVNCTRTHMMVGGTVVHERPAHAKQ